VSTGVQQVLVVGAGQMGSGIAQVAAQSGFQVTMVDTAPQGLDSGLARIEHSLTRLVRSGRLDHAAADDARGRINTTIHLAPAAEVADLVIEAVVEDLAVKQGLFAELDRACAPDAVLATNTSQFRITRIAAACERPDRVIGMHFSNPPPLMRLVEVILGDLTSPETRDTAEAFIGACGREVVVCRKDVPGFISNRLSTALFMEAARLVDEGVASPDDVDKVARLMYGHKMGPIETLDLAGLDTALRVATALAQHYGGDRFTPPTILADLVAQTRLGNKSGSGFYERAEPHIST
jgi:3-hydroxybutyryl-CoA dehydrogenase